MTVIIHKNFLTLEECTLLNKVVDQGLKEGWINKGIQASDNKYDLRYTSRIHMEQAEYPQIVRDISNKVRAFMGLDSYPLIEGHGKDGVVVSITFQGGSVYRHKDPNAQNNPAYRCNILTQANENGAEIYVNGKLVEVGVGDLHCYAVSELDHFVTEAKGKTPRIMWMFGASVPMKDLKERGLI